MKHIVSLSGGTASAVAANRVIQRKGKDNVILWFADTSWEDEDLYRFLIDLENFWDKEIGIWQPLLSLPAYVFYVFTTDSI